MNNGNCTEVASTAGLVAVRDSQDPAGPVLHYSSTSWISFVAAARNGKFDSFN
jgi:Domain of unknown function (DUF397)